MVKIPIEATAAVTKAASQWGVAAAMLLLVCLRLSRHPAVAQAGLPPLRKMPGYALLAAVFLTPETALARDGSKELRLERHAFADLHAGASVSGLEAGVYTPLDGAVVATARTTGRSTDLARDTAVIGFRKFFGNSLYASAAVGGAMLHEGDQESVGDDEPLDRGLVYDVAIGNQWLFGNGFSLGVEWLGRELWAVHRPGRRDAGRALTVALGIAF
jgi:hypothetical protein